MNVTEDDVSLDNKAHDKQLAFLRERLKSNAEFFHRRRDYNSWVALRIKISIATLGAIISVVLGLRLAHLSTELASDIALVLSAFVTVLSITDATFDFRWRWISYGLTLTRIYGLKDELEYFSASETGATSEQLDSIFWRLQATLADMNNNWASRQRQDTTHSEEQANLTRTGPIEGKIGDRAS